MNAFNRVVIATGADGQLRVTEDATAEVHDVDDLFFKHAGDGGVLGVKDKAAGKGWLTYLHSARLTLLDNRGATFEGFATRITDDGEASSSMVATATPVRVRFARRPEK